MIPEGITRFHGIYPSTVLPMRADFSPDWDAYAKHTAHCTLRDGIAGVLMNGHAGENFVLSRAEKKRAVEVTVATVGATRIVVAGVNAESSLEAAAEAREAQEAGADAIMVFLPNSFALAHSTAQSLLHHRIIRDAVPAMPIWLFQAHHAAGRMGFSESTLDALLEMPEVVGIKEGGWEVDGYDGSLVSLADLMPDEIVALDAAVRANDLPGARALHERLEPLAEAIYGTPPGGRATARLKFCLVEMGIIPCPAIRPPQPPVEGAEAVMLRAAMQASGL
jgi:4-hydroxy-tetrahydrodipicolinate synthase